jgi:hypothetical protein
VRAGSSQRGSWPDGGAGLEGSSPAVAEIAAPALGNLWRRARARAGPTCELWTRPTRACMRSTSVRLFAPPAKPIDQPGLSSSVYWRRRRLVAKLRSQLSLASPFSLYWFMVFKLDSVSPAHCSRVRWPGCRRSRPGPSLNPPPPMRGVCGPGCACLRQANNCVIV